MHIDLSDDIVYPTEQDILSVHSDIIDEDSNAESGAINAGNIGFVLNYINHGHFGEVPTTIHSKAAHLMRLLAANHTFVDGNKRTALNTTWTFYIMNGYYFDYGEEIKAILKLFAVMERMVDIDETTDYFEDISKPIEKSEAVEEDIRDLFSYYRETTTLLYEIDERLHTGSKYGEILEATKKINVAIGNSEEVARMFEESSDEEILVFTDILYEHVEKLRELNDDAIDILESY